MSSKTSFHLPLSLVLITRDAEAELTACLVSAPFVDEIVIVDSGSADNTRKIAADSGARVIEQAWLGFGRQRNFAVGAARNDWVLCLDADERVTPQLADAITSLWRRGATPQAAAYALCRRNRFLGRWLRYGEGYPDWVIRLFDRRRACWSDDDVHEKVLLDEGAMVARLDGDLLHESAESIDAYIVKQNCYTSIQAERAFAQGKRVSAWRLFAAPLARFFRFYIVKGGFLDGAAGFAHIAIGAWTSFLKYAKLYALQRNDHHTRDITDQTS
ncbi:MAG: glycosyltransferase family 2 protein [Burkholderiales bacterium]|nr:glycosyltransferase family 2 protein [Burkholderiales bacterium]